MSQAPLPPQPPIHLVVDSAAAEHEALGTENAQLRQEIARLSQENQALKMALSTIAEQGIATALADSKAQSTKDEAGSGTVAGMLRALAALSREKADLEIILQTIMEHGDAVDAQWRQKLQETVWLSEIDGLTQVANRRKFDAYLSQQWQHMGREQLALAVLLCDIDHFKQYNDSKGHLAGDAVLRQVAQALAQAVPRPLDLLSRYGGEEFATILPQTDAAGAMAVAERMQAAIAALQIAHPASPVSKQLTVSIGIAAVIPQPHQVAIDLVNTADQMLYLAKQQGRNQIVYHALEYQEHQT